MPWLISLISLFSQPSARASRQHPSWTWLLPRKVCENKSSEWLVERSCPGRQTTFPRCLPWPTPSVIPADHPQYRLSHPWSFRAISEITQEVQTLTTLLVDDREVAEALASLDSLWQSLTPAEQAQLIHLLVEKVEFDGMRGMVTLRLQPTGIKALYEQTARSGEDAA